MRKVKTLCKRSFALFLAAVLCISVSQITVFAEDVSPLPTPSVSNIEPTGNATKPDDVVEDGTDGSKKPESTTEKWEDPSHPGVEGEKVTTPNGNGGKDITWSGDNANDTNRDESIKVNGSENTTNKVVETDGQNRPVKENETTKGNETIVEVSKEPNPSSEPVEIDPGDEFSKGNVNITVDLDGSEGKIVDAVLSSEGKLEIKDPDYAGYEFKRHTGSIYVYSRVEADGSVTYLSLEETKDANGAIIYKTAYTESEKVEVDKDAIVESLKPDPPDDGYKKVDEDEDTYIKKNEDGSVVTIWKREEILDPDDETKVIGYKVVQSTTITKVEESDFDINEKPESSIGNPDADGYVTNVKVEDIVDDSTKEVIGYKVTTIVTSADGKSVTTEVKTVTTQKKDLGNGKSTTQTITSTTTSVTTEITSSQEVGEITDGEVEVTVGSVTEGEGHGNLKTESLKPDMKLDPQNGATDWNKDLYGWEDHQIYCITTQGLRIRKSASTSGAELGKLNAGEQVYISETKESGNHLWGHIKKKVGDQWVSVGWTALEKIEPKGSNSELAKPNDDDGDFGFYGGYGLSSAIAVGYFDEKDGKEHYYNVHQFIVRDADGKPHYAYCADLSVNPEYEAIYDMENIEDATFLKNPEVVNAIASNGYWGTESGTGSLASFKDWLTKIGYKGKINLTEGQAMAITQAVIWYYGSSGDKSVLEGKNPFDVYYYKGNQSKDLSDAAKMRVNEIYKFLIDEKNKDAILANSKNTATELLNAENITQVSVTVKKKVEEATAELMKTSTEDSLVNNSVDGIYLTDVKFVLDITPSKIDDNLIVKVVDALGNTKTYRLAGENSETTGYGVIEQAEDGSYTIPDLYLKEGTAVTLNLSGTQKVTKGAYLISASAGYDTSQTFISVEEGTRDVNLNIELSFDVSKASAEIKSVEPYVSKTETQKSWSSKSETTYEYTPESSTPTPTPTPSGDDDTDDDDDDIPDEPTPQSEDPEDPVEEIPEDPVPLTNIPNDPVPLANAPLSVELVELPDEEVPLAGLTDIFDEEVPLADVPETGDISVLWYVLILASGVGLLVLRTADAKKHKNH